MFYVVLISVISLVIIANLTATIILRRQNALQHRTIQGLKAVNDRLADKIAKGYENATKPKLNIETKDTKIFKSKICLCDEEIKKFPTAAQDIAIDNLYRDIFKTIKPYIVITTYRNELTMQTEITAAIEIVNRKGDF